MTTNHELFQRAQARIFLQQPESIVIDIGVEAVIVSEMWLVGGTALVHRRIGDSHDYYPYNYP